MGVFDDKFKVEKADPPKKSGNNTYPYKVTEKATNEVSYLSQKGLDAVKNQTT